MADDQARSLQQTFFSENLASSDRELAEAIGQELHRQQTQIELIASENIVSRAVLEAQGSPLTNKYAEGYPGKRYYGGCEYVDIAENLARDRAKKLFGAAYANVQPNSGSQANQAVFLALLKPGDKILGLDLSAGGHLTHGAKPNLSGKWFEAHHYGVREDDALIDYDALRDQAKKLKPQMLIAGGSAYPRTIDFEAFRSIADEVGAYLLVDMAHFAGLVAAKIHPDPVPHAMLLTGIVVAISASAFAIRLARSYHSASGRPPLSLDGDRQRRLRVRVREELRDGFDVLAALLGQPIRVLSLGCVV